MAFGLCRAMVGHYCASLCDEFRDFSKRSSLRLTRRELEVRLFLLLSVVKGTLTLEVPSTQDFATSPFFSSTRAFYLYRLGAGSITY